MSIVHGLLDHRLINSKAMDYGLLAIDFSSKLFPIGCLIATRDRGIHSLISSLFWR